jgi:hypothetical protein
MRNTVFASSLVVVAVGGLAGGVTSASDPGAAPPDTIPGSELLEGLGFTPEQLQCLAQNTGTIDITDLTSFTDLMAECELSMDQLFQIGQQAPATAEVETSATVGEGVTPSEIDAAAAAAALELLGLDQATLDCLVSEAGGAMPDDQGAELAFFNCEVGLGQLLAGIVALEVAASGAESDATTAESAATTPTVDSTSATVAPTGNALLDSILERLDPEQAQCVLDNAPDLDLSDVTALAALVETCGLELSDILPGG